MTSQTKNLLGIVVVLAVIFGTTNPVSAETVNLVFQVSVPNSANELDVHLAGNFQGWDPGNPDFRLENLGNGKYEIMVPLERDRILQFKFTRGSWATVEKGPAGEEISNRMLRVQEAGTHEFEVAVWADQNSNDEAVSTITGHVETVDIPNFLGGRKVLIYLPADYFQNTTKSYPVLYMFDGQNVFDEATSFAGEWKADEWCEKLIASNRIRPVIVVAVANGSQKRGYEYTPWSNGDGSGGGAEHLQIIVDELVPHINKHFRILTGPENTALTGSSYGGLMTLYAAGRHRDTFGLFAAVSPSLEWGKETILSFAVSSIEPGIRLYMDMGGLESGMKVDKNGNGVDDSLDSLRELRLVLRDNGFQSGDDFVYLEDRNGRHNEAAWSRRFMGILIFLFPRENGDH